MRVSVSKPLGMFGLNDHEGLNEIQFCSGHKSSTDPKACRKLSMMPTSDLEAQRAHQSSKQVMKW